MGTKFSKGKWTIESDEDGIIIDSTDSPGWIALVQYLPKDLYVDEGKANAHLIAASPRMYEALEDAYNLWEDGGELSFKHFHEVILPLLAKARGEGV